MSCSQILNSIGLIINIFGVVIIFKYGFPQPSFEKGSPLGLEDNTVLSNGKTVKETAEEAKKQKVIYREKSSFGLSLIILGFIFQLIAINI